MKRSIVVFLITLFVPNLISAQITEQGQRIYIRGSIGYGKLSMKDVNQGINDDEDYFNSLGLYVNWDDINGSINYSGELGVRISNILSVGIGLSYQKDEVNNSLTDYSASYLDDIEVSIMDLNGVLTLWVPNTKGLFFGVNAGIGFGSMTEFVSLNVFEDPSSSFSVETTASGKGFTGGIFTGYELNFASGPLIYIQFGYRYRNLGAFEGDSYSPEYGSGSGTIMNNMGQALDFDYSGLYFNTGFGVSFGGQIQ